MVGDAVPPPLAKAVAMTLKETMTAVRKGHRESEPVFSDETFEAMLESLDFDINLDEAK